MLAPLQTKPFLYCATLLSLPHPEGYPPLAQPAEAERENPRSACRVAVCGSKTTGSGVCLGRFALGGSVHPGIAHAFSGPSAHDTPVRCAHVSPEFIPPWGVHSYLSQLTLSRLGRSHVETMVEKVTGDKALPPEVVQQIVSKTDGVPLFVEELTKTVLESVES